MIIRLEPKIKDKWMDEEDYNKEIEIYRKAYEGNQTAIEYFLDGPPPYTEETVFWMKRHPDIEAFVLQSDGLWPGELIDVCNKYGEPEIASKISNAWDSKFESKSGDFKK